MAKERESTFLKMHNRDSLLKIYLVTFLKHI